MPYSHSKERKKLIHSVGTVGKVMLISTGNHPFTGAFTGTNTGIVRISLALEPVPSVKNIAPGMGLKFFRDGIESASLVAMYSVDGQDSWNIFANDWSNHIGRSSAISTMALANHFSSVSDYV